MRKVWIVSLLCAGLGAGFMSTSTEPAQAAMVVSSGKANMSLIEPAARKAKRRARQSCWEFFCQRCCTDPRTGKETCRGICM
jgi:hypothetical protein